MPKRFYLDTSVVRSRLIGHSSIQTFLVKKLENSTKIMSPYVKREFDRSFICNLIAFYVNLKGQHSVSDAIKWWTEDFSVRKIKDVNYDIAPVLLGIKEDTDINQALLNLRNEIKKIVTIFGFLINRLEKNETLCRCFDLNFESNITEDIEKVFIQFYQNYRNFNYASGCRIVDFFDKKKEILKKIRAYTSKEDGFKDQQEKIETVLSGKSKLSCGNCGVLGDTIIALECPDYAVLLSTDKAFVDLCKIIGIKYEIIDSLRTSHPISKILKVLQTPLNN